MATLLAAGENFISYIFDVVVRAVPALLLRLATQNKGHRRHMRPGCSPPSSAYTAAAAANQLDVNGAAAHL